MSQILLYSLLVMLASLVGVITIWQRVGEIVERNLSLLMSFSAGVFVVIVYHLLGEVIEHSTSPVFGLILVFVGAVGIWTIFKLVPSSHHHHDVGLEAQPHSRIDARRIMTSDAFHNIGDGILIAASFTASSSLGVVIALSVIAHELVQEISEFFVLKQAGYSTKKALLLNFIISSTILIGSIGGFFLLEYFETVEVVILGLAAGSLLVVVFHDLIPHSVRSSRNSKLYFRHITWFILGIGLMYFISNLVAH